MVFVSSRSPCTDEALCSFRHAPLVGDASDGAQSGIAPEATVGNAGAVGHIRRCHHTLVRSLHSPYQPRNQSPLLQHFRPFSSRAFCPSGKHNRCVSSAASEPLVSTQIRRYIGSNTGSLGPPGTPCAIFSHRGPCAHRLYIRPCGSQYYAPSRSESSLSVLSSFQAHFDPIEYTSTLGSDFLAEVVVAEEDAAGSGASDQSVSTVPPLDMTSSYLLYSGLARQPLVVGRAQLTSR